MTPRSVSVVLWAIAWLGLGPTAGATPLQACLPVPGGGELTVAGMGRAVFAGLVTDRARDAARLSGGVCLELTEIGAVLRSEVLEIRDVRGEVVVEAVDVTLEVMGWQLATGRLWADATTAVLGPTVMRGREAVARAGGVTIDLFSGAAEATELRLLTASLWVDARVARLEGSRVIARDTWLTTCDCPPVEADVRVEATRADIELAPPSVVLSGGTLVVGAVRWPLPEPFALDEEALASPTLPFTVGPDPEGRRGTLIAFEERTVAPGVRFAWDVGSGEGDRPPDLALRLAARDAGASVDVMAASDRLRVAWRLGWPWRGGTLSLGQRLEGGAWREPVRDLDLRWTRGSSWSPVVGARANASVTAFVAVSSQSLPAEEPVGSRFGVEGRLRTEASPGSEVRPALVLAGGATGYAGDVTAPAQAWVSVEPSVIARGQSWTVEARHLSRWVAGGSPFGTTLDRVVPVHRSDLVATGASALGDVASLSTRVAFRWDWRRDELRSGRAVGLERLEVRLDLRRSAWGGEVHLHGDARLAGWLDPRAGRAFTLQGGAAWEGRKGEVGVVVRAAPGAAETPTEVIVFGSLPLRAGDWSLRPYLALDVATLVRERTLAWTGHGVDVTWAASFATLRLGYRHDRAVGTSLRLGVELEARDLDPERLGPWDRGLR